jgi:cysteine desulfurase
MPATIYLDHAATSPLRPEVREAMLPWLHGHGNPSSLHAAGRAARVALEAAREQVAGTLGAGRGEIVFTSGGTEANNLAVLGRWRRLRRGAVVCSAIEHSSVLGAARTAAAEGAILTLLAVDEDGRTQPDALRDALRLEPAVVSVMWGNNEVGALQPIGALGDACREAGACFHVDAVQAIGRVPVRVDRSPCDLLTVSAHKLGGPAGAGALFVRAGTGLEPLARGGGQENGLRAGTENLAAAVGLARAIELAVAEQAAEAQRLAGLRDRLAELIAAAAPGTRINAAGAERLPHILSLSVPGVDREALLLSLDLEGVAASAGSACRSGTSEPSHVLAAMGGQEDTAVIRLSLGRTSTADEVQEAARRFGILIPRLRAHAPEQAP